jgi:hypothetical protein
MEKILSLDEEINEILKKKKSDSRSRSSKSIAQTKDKYFQELKDTLTKYNKEYLLLNLIRNDFVLTGSQKFSLINY